MSSSYLRYIPALMLSLLIPALSAETPNEDKEEYVSPLTRIQDYAARTNMQHLGFLCLTDAEIEEHYKADVARAMESDRRRARDDEELEDALLTFQMPEEPQRPNETVAQNNASPFRAPPKKARTEQALNLDVAEQRFRMPPAPNNSPQVELPMERVKLPVRKPGTSVHTNPRLSADYAGTIVLYDTETTNLHAKCGGRVCELAGLKVHNGVPTETLHLLFNPNMKSWDGAYKAHGLSEKYLRTQAPFYRVARQVEDFFGDHIRVAHNGAKFDDPYLMFEMRRAQVFWLLKKMIEPSQDFSDLAPRSVKFNEAKAREGHAYLREMRVLSDDQFGPKGDSDHQANLLASAAMIYFFRDYFSQDKTSSDKPGPMMFKNGRILPDPETHKENYEAAVSRLAWFRLILVETEKKEDRDRLRYPHEKFVRDAVQSAQVYIKVVIDLFERGLLDKTAFFADPLDTAKMFDTLVFARTNTEKFARGFTVENLKLDTLMDYYGINRFAREDGVHGAGIDTSLLYQVFRSMLGMKNDSSPTAARLFAMHQKDLEQHLFQKNSVRHFDAAGNITETTKLHDDQIAGTLSDARKESVDKRRKEGLEAQGGAFMPYPNMGMPQGLAMPSAPMAMSQQPRPTPYMGYTGMSMQQQPMPIPYTGYPGMAVPQHPMPTPYMSFPGMMMHQQPMPTPYTGYPGMAVPQHPMPTPYTGYPGMMMQQQPMPTPYMAYPSMMMSQQLMPQSPANPQQGFSWGNGQQFNG